MIRSLLLALALSSGAAGAQDAVLPNDSVPALDLQRYAGEWHEIAQFCKLCAILAAGVEMRNSGRSDDPKLAYFQTNLDSWIALTRAMLDDAGL